MYSPTTRTIGTFAGILIALALDTVDDSLDLPIGGNGLVFVISFEISL